MLCEISSKAPSYPRRRESDTAATTAIAVLEMALYQQQSQVAVRPTESHKEFAHDARHVVQRALVHLVEVERVQRILDPEDARPDGAERVTCEINEKTLLETVVTDCETNDILYMFDT